MKQFLGIQKIQIPDKKNELCYLIWILYCSSDVLYLSINKKFCKISDCKYFIFNIPRAQPIYSHRSPQRTKLFLQVRRERQEQQLETELIKKAFININFIMVNLTFMTVMRGSFKRSTILEKMTKLHSERAHLEGI